MAKGYWINSYRRISNPEALAAYASQATPAIHAGGGRILARGLPALVHGAGIAERTVVIEFDSVSQAVATFHSDAYQAALQALGTAVERDFRIVEGG
ncbi:DUF1330 domain-containing protein [Cupriavidus sp. CuC1]|uniref:DUF1330 domain-containing protein n=1 Tax=Cupriavidus sp. CuC1 TaxID=3373131 RepID=UPI0037D573D5